LYFIDPEENVGMRRENKVREEEKVRWRERDVGGKKESSPANSVSG
jgi:hypothetical protein